VSGSDSGMSSFEGTRKGALSRSLSDDNLSNYSFGNCYGFDLNQIGVGDGRPLDSSSSSSGSSSSSAKATGNTAVAIAPEAVIGSDIGSNTFAATDVEVTGGAGPLWLEDPREGDHSEEDKALQELLRQKNAWSSLSGVDGENIKATGKTFVILVVDDSSVHRKVCRNSLAHMSTKFNLQILVNTVENGERALEMHGNKDSIPDVMIIDEYMSGMGGRMLGHEVVEICRARPDFDNCVIIGCTAKSDISSGKFMEAGCDAVWIKPMPKKLEALRQIKELVKQRASPPQDRARANDLLKEDLIASELDRHGKAAAQSNKYALFSEWSHVPKRFKHLHQRSLEEKVESPVLLMLEGIEILVSGNSDTISTISGSFI